MRVLSQRIAGSLLLALSLIALALPSAQAEVSNKWRIKIDHSANTAGVMLFVVAPPNVPPIEVSVNVAQGTRENLVAKDIENAFKAALPKDAFHIERDDHEDVLVKKKHGEDNFGLAMVANSVEGITVRIHKE